MHLWRASLPAPAKAFTDLNDMRMQACGEVYASHAARLPQQAVVAMLDVLQSITVHARSLDSNVQARRALAAAQHHDQVHPSRVPAAIASGPVRPDLSLQVCLFLS